jgi:hypothetical protein
MSYWYALVVFYLSFHCSLWKMFAFWLRWSLPLSKAISTMFFGIIAVFPSKLHLAAMHYNENASNSDMPSSIQNTSGGTTLCWPWRDIQFTVSYFFTPMVMTNVMSMKRKWLHSAFSQPTLGYVDTLQHLLFGDVVEMPQPYQELLEKVPVFE